LIMTQDSEQLDLKAAEELEKQYDSGLTTT
jgi:hypothetical protein